MSEKEPLFQRKLKRVGSDCDQGREFSLVSYNILCDLVFTNNLAKYSYAPEDVKLRGPDPNSAIRHTQLMKELHWLDADVVCLQEVEAFYFPYLVEELDNRGYQGSFKNHLEGMESHGLATFYKTDKFIMKESYLYGFNDLLGKVGDPNEFLKDSNKDNQRFAQYTILEEKQTGKQIAIVNIHLMYGGWTEPDVQAIQAALFFQQLHDILPPCSKYATPWIACGDFNMRPHFPGYELVGNGKLSDENFEKLNPAKYKHPEVIERSEVTNDDSVVLRKHKNVLYHPFHGTKSAYKSVLGSEPDFTHYECDDSFPELFGIEIMKDTLDYIWYSSDILQVNAVLEMVEEEVITPLTACPNKFFPSDHLSLKACFQFL